MGKSWFDIQNKSKSKSADIYIYSEIGGFEMNAQSFIDEFKHLKNKDINVHINSLGGSVFDGLAIYTALKNHSKKVTTKVEGIAASIASVIAMAGDSIEIAENSLFMIHNPFAMAGGDATELRKTASVLDKIRDEIADIYAKKSKQDTETLVGLMDAETWFNSNETLELGFVNNVTGAVEIQNNYDISKFSNITSEKINSIINSNKNYIKMEEKSFKTEESVATENQSLLSKIKSLFQNAEGDEDDTPAEDVDWAKSYEELKDRVDNLENAIHDIEEKVGMKDEEIENAKSELETANTEVENKEKEISKLKAGKTDVVAQGDPTINKNKDEDKNMAFFNAMAKAIQRSA